MPNESSGKRAAQAAALSPPRWRGARSLELVYQLNDRCLELLSQMAAGNEDDCPLALVNLHRELWRNLDGNARQRAARLPFVIVDVHFTNSRWWQRARKPAVPPEVPAVACFPTEIGEHLMNETLMFVWHIVQSDSRGAVHIVGMSPDVSAIVAGLSAHELRDIAAQNAGEIEPRWRDSPHWWGALLAAAISDDQLALADIHLQAKLLLCGVLLSSDS